MSLFTLEQIDKKKHRLKAFPNRIMFPYSTQNCGFKNIWSWHLVKQLWPPDGYRTEGRLSTTLAEKGCVLSTQQKRSFKWIDPSEWWWREKWWTRRESLWLPAIGTWGCPIRAYRYKRAMSVMFPISMAPGPHSSISEGFQHSIFSGLRRILGSRKLVNPRLRMNEAWMDECAARLQPLVDQYKPRQRQTFPKKNSEISS